MSADPLLSVRDLAKHYPITEGLFRRETGRVRAVDGVSFDLERGETLGLVGESGCGKSTAARALVRLEEPTAGSVTFDGEPLTEFGPSALKRFRRRAGMIFQDPTASFDPRQSIGESVAEPLEVHGLRDRRRRRELVEAMLERVGLTAADADRYPHELSGGQKQRAALARALVLEPDLLVADEPVSALDVSVQAEILALLDELQAAFDLSVVLISHDMAVVRQICDRVAVMYLGELVEIGPTEALFTDPQHPYTRALVNTVPSPDPASGPRDVVLSDDVPDPSDPPSGCRFHTRCPEVIPPEQYELDQGDWRQVVGLRARLAEADVEPADLAAGDELAGDSGGPDPAAIRRAFELPAQLGDPDAEAVLSTALGLAADGELAAAEATLRDGFPTPCIRDRPAMRDTDAGHPAACHLHEAD